MDSEESIEEPLVAPELYFLVAKFLSTGPLQNTSEVLRRELEKCKILPRRVDWEGNIHDQTFEDLERQYPNVSNDHLLSVCSALLKTPKDKPKKSLLCNSLFCKPIPKRPGNVLDRVFLREYGVGTRRPLPASVYGSLQLQRRTLGHLSAVYCVLFDRSGRYIITGADDLLVKVWSAIDGRLLGTLRGASAEITDMAVDTDNKLLAAGSLDRQVRVWDMQTSAPVAVLQGHNGMITSVHFCPSKSGDLNTLVSTSTDGSVAFWTYSQSNGGKPSFISKPVQYVERMRPGACQMICAAWSPGGVFLAAGSADHHVRVYMMTDSGPNRILETAAHSEAVDSLQWAHSGLRFVSGSKDGTAILWQLHATQWRHSKLNMTDTLGGEPVEYDENKKTKVTMVGWDCTDSYIITAVNDCTLKIWCSHTAKLVRVLRGHTDEIYVLETHPAHPAILLSAGHDGQLFIWDILKGVSLGSFLNHIDGQGHGAVFDAKWSPDGSKVAATDSHGHILIMGLGKGHPLLQKLPRELFFHTDYRPLMRDAQGGVCDEQTGVPPHLMPPPFLVDVEGSPHPPKLQRLVPGREHAALDQLVPDTGTVMLEDVALRSHIDYMIEALAMRQIGFLNGNADANLFENGQGEVDFRLMRGEGVRHSAGEWQRGEQLVRSRRAMVAPLHPAACATTRLRIEEMHRLETAWYIREMRRRPQMISTCASGDPGGGAKRPRGKGRGKGGGQAVRKASRPTPATRYREPPESHHSESDSTVKVSGSDYSGYQSVSTDQSDDNNDSSSSSSDYSDWVAEHPGVPLQPPKRSKRKPVARKRYSPHTRPTTTASSSPTKKTESQPQPMAENIEAEAGPSVSSKPVTADIPEAYRPSEWLCAVQPRKAPYHPQMGDECVYFKQGHARYLDAVAEKNVYTVTSRDQPWNKVTLKDRENVKVIGIKYMIRPPRVVSLKLVLDSGGHFTVRYHDMPDVLDFLVLRQTFDTAAERQWVPGDRFRCMIDDGWWMGAVVEDSESNSKGSSDLFLSLRVRWDNGEYEQMSPWDLEPVDDDRLPKEVGGWVSVLPSELEALLYRPRPEEWPGGDRQAACQMIAKGIDQVMGLAIAEPFVAPVDLNAYPSYAYVIEYPIDLSTIKARFENHFYRRVTSAQFDVRYMATNAEKFNLTHSHIIKQARIITDLCLKVISDPFDIDVPTTYHSLVDTYHSSDSDLPLSKQGTSKEASGAKSSGRHWKSRCKNVLNGLLANADSFPFRSPVSVHQMPDYLQVVAIPMDLYTVQQRLQSDQYPDPPSFAKDIRLIFSNSKIYNTNKRSRVYAMTVRLENLFETLFRPILHNWKVTKRRNGAHATSNSSSESYSDNCGAVEPPRRRPDQNGHVVRKNQDGRGKDSDSWDSDVPLRESQQYKGKGKGKRSDQTMETSPPVRTSRRTRPPSHTPVQSHHVSEYLQLQQTSTSRNSERWGDEADEDEFESDNESRVTDDDSGESYKPTKNDSGVILAFHGKAAKRKKGKRKMDDKKRTTNRMKHSRKRPKAKRRKRASGVTTEDMHSSSETGVSIVTGATHNGRYESDHSFQLRAIHSGQDNNRQNSNSDGDSDDAPLGNMRRPLHSLNGQNSNVGRYNLDNSDESGAGPSSARTRPARDSKRPRYNEDSEEDSIAAISKRLRAHQRPRSNPITVQSRLRIPSATSNQTMERRNGDRGPSGTGRSQIGRPSGSAPRSGPSTSSSSGSVGRHINLPSALTVSHYTVRSGPDSASISMRILTPARPATAAQPDDEDDEPLSVSSRGRIRKLTAKARGLLRD